MPRLASLDKRIPVAVLALLLLVVAAFVAAKGVSPDTKKADGTIAFVGVNVVPMDREHVLANQTVVVQDGQVVSMAPAKAARIPGGARRIDGAGRWLMPGLAEMHGHVPGSDDPAYRDAMLFLYVANGVTTVRNMAGNASHLALRDRVAKGELLGPTLHTASPWLSAAVAGTREKARQAVRDYRAAGYDLIKIGSVPRDAYLAMAETANGVGLPFAVISPKGCGSPMRSEADRPRSTISIAMWSFWFRKAPTPPDGRQASSVAAGCSSPMNVASPRPSSARSRQALGTSRR